uniref:Immunoglobulin domain-containing protein n=1 Tax=Sus scrofa TaxID=9823 RepID=A0A8D1VBU9_PIG
LTAALTSGDLGVGRSCDLVSQVFPGTLPKPILWPEPDPLVTWGSPVTIWCQGTLGAQECHLYAEGRPALGDRLSPLEAGDKAKFFIQYMTQDYAGRYQCYCHSPTGRSEPSDALELVVTGERTLRGKPTLSALPSPVVASGRNVTLQGGSRQGYDRLIPTKEGEPKPSWTLDTQRYPNRQTWALFPVGPVTPSHRAMFRCYGCLRDKPQVRSPPSDPLELLVSGEEGPSWSQRLWAPRQVPGGWLRAEPHVRGWLGGRGSRTRTQSVRDSETWGPGGTRGSWGKQPLTQGSLSPGGSGKPSLLTPQGPVVASGQSLTLQCRSAIGYDRFALAKEGGPPGHPGGLFLAEFSMSPVTSAHGGTYRCHGSLSSDPYLLSHPSDPLELMVSAQDPRVLGTTQGRCRESLVRRGLQGQPQPPAPSWPLSQDPWEPQPPPPGPNSTMAESRGPFAHGAHRPPRGSFESRRS